MLSGPINRVGALQALLRQRSLLINPRWKGIRYPFGSYNEHGDIVTGAVFRRAFKSEEGLNDLRADTFLTKQTMLHPVDTILDLQQFRISCGQKQVLPSPFFLKKNPLFSEAENSDTNCGTALELRLAFARSLFDAVRTQLRIRSRVTNLRLEYLRRNQL